MSGEGETSAGGPAPNHRSGGAGGRAQEGADRPGRISRRVIHDGRVVNLGIDRVHFPDGSEGELELVEHAGAAAVLPVVGTIAEADPEILLIRQYRYAAGGDLYEVPAGTLDPTDPTWEFCARRELEEETGYKAMNLRPLTRIYTTPGFTDEVIHLFLAEQLIEGTPGHDRDEFLEVVPLPLSRALEWVEDGTIIDGKSIVTLLYAATYLRDG